MFQSYLSTSSFRSQNAVNFHSCVQSYANRVILMDGDSSVALFQGLVYFRENSREPNELAVTSKHLAVVAVGAAEAFAKVSPARLWFVML